MQRCKAAKSSDQIRSAVGDRCTRASSLQSAQTRAAARLALPRAHACHKSPGARSAGGPSCGALLRNFALELVSHPARTQATKSRGQTSANSGFYLRNLRVSNEIQ